MKTIILLIVILALISMAHVGTMVSGESQRTNAVLNKGPDIDILYNTIQDQLPFLDQPPNSGLSSPVPGDNTMGSTENLLSGLGLANQSQLAETPKGNISRMIEQEFNANATMAGLVFVNYESPTTVVFHGDALSPGGINYNTNLWKAVDLLKNDLGYTLDQVLINGLGTRDNPERFVILMTKE